jgi:hypothetical protein
LDGLREARGVLDELLKKFPATAREPSGGDSSGIPAAARGIFDLMAGVTLAGGFYRFHTPASVRRSNEACARLINGFEGRFSVFAFDWLGRELAVDIRDASEGAVICVDPGGGEYLTTDCPLSEWHDAVAGEQDPIAYPFYLDWRRANPGAGPLAFTHAIGYKGPLFLGGEDEVANLEVCDREVYFDLCTQLARGTRKLPLGETIHSIVISE